MKSKIFTKIFRFCGKRLNHCSTADADSVKNVPDTEEFERCIICGKLTCVPISMPIDWRENYEVGCGQLCAECAKKQQRTEERESTLTNAQIMLAVEQSRRENNK